jgi:predicted alpha/beta-fold hydrolase
MEEYGEVLKLANNVASFKAPTLIFGSDDDPFTLKSAQPVMVVGASPNAALVTFPEGGHVSFCTGMDAKKSVIEPVLLKWFDAIYSNKPNNSYLILTKLISRFSPIEIVSIESIASQDS